MPTIIIKVVANVGGIVVQSRQQYLDEGLRQLADPKFYIKQEYDTCTTETQNPNNDFLATVLQKGEIDCSVYDYLINKECIISMLDLLPKSTNGKLHHLAALSSLLSLATQRKSLSFWIT